MQEEWRRTFEDLKRSKVRSGAPRRSENHDRVPEEKQKQL
jgi:hypothetical protein